MDTTKLVEYARQAAYGRPLLMTFGDIIMTLTLVLKLLNIAPALLQEGEAAIKELSSNDDNKTKIKAAIADAQAALETLAKLVE